MATKLFLRETANNGIGSFRDMLAAAGSSLTTGVVNTAASGTNIQWTKTAGGAVLEWISGRAPSGGFTLSGTMTFNIWALESNGQANAGGRARYYKRTAAGVLTEIATSPADDGVEFGASAAAMNWTETPTSTAFSEDDRLVVRYFITNIGTMGGSRTCTLNYDAGTGGANGDSWVQINENVTFKAEEVTGAGTPAAQAATASGAGESSSGGSGGPAAQAATASGAGLSTSSGSGSLSAGSATASGEGEASAGDVTGSGDIFADASSAAGEGESSSAGIGALPSSGPMLAGEGLSTSTGSGVLEAQSATAAGAGVSSSSGEGALAIDAAATAGGGLSASSGAGTLGAQSATASSAGVSSSTGSGALSAGASAVAAEGIGQSAGEGTLAAAGSAVAGSEADVISGAGELIADAAALPGAGQSWSLGDGLLDMDLAAISGAGLASDQEQPEPEQPEPIVTDVGIPRRAWFGPADYRPGHRPASPRPPCVPCEPRY